ncbi:MAG TPA: cell envelope integrity protein CreD [Mucilaginibacter sp.]|jgi:inner membrane protein|nr:cell envelope integrity protein CreD [Mucilaginibacter sp.]
MTEQPQNPSRWNQDSILIKLGFIIALVLLLLIPSAWIQSLISDRESYQQQNISQVADQWAGNQLVQGPVLALPYRDITTENNSAGKPVTHTTIKTLYVLPQTLQIKAGIETQNFSKSVYDAVVYNSNVSAQGSFDKPDLATQQIDPAAVLYDKARLIFSISDLKGLKDNPVVTINGQAFPVQPAENANGPLDNGFQVNFPLVKEQGLSFSCKISLKGSDELNFMDLGKTTSVEINSDWNHPEFNGHYLPDTRRLKDKGFTAKWQIMNYDSPFPRQWTDGDSVLTNKKAISASSFGVRTEPAIDQYRKITRTAKYAILIILLTFVSLFLTEMIKKQRIHVFNYSLIGAAMVVYYTLLLSFSEQIGYNYAYLVSSVSTITLIAVFVASLLKNRGMAFLFALILSIFYGFIFIIIQLEELSLLFGSVALFIIIAVLMYFSRKINWDKQYGGYTPAVEL